MRCPSYLLSALLWLLCLQDLGRATSAAFQPSRQPARLTLLKVRRPPNNNNHRIDGRHQQPSYQHETAITYLTATSRSSIEEIQLTLDTGIRAQVLFSVPTKSTVQQQQQQQQQQQPPLVFVHGSFHAAWCWAEHYFDYFTAMGYPVVALSLRGTGGSFAGKGVKKILIEEHVADLKSLLHQLPTAVLGARADDDRRTISDKPVLISHSFGGLTVMKLLELYPEEADDLAGVVTMCSVPPSGNGPMTTRFLKRSLVDSYKITVGFVAKRCIKKVDLCRDLFFGGDTTTLSDGRVEEFGISDEEIRRYQGYFDRDTKAIINVAALLKSLPSKEAVDGKAPYVSKFPPSLVIGASRDFIVDRVGVEETATYFGLDEALFLDSPHDVMLGSNWRSGAQAIHDFVQEKVKAGAS